MQPTLLLLGLVAQVLAVPAPEAKGDTQKFDNVPTDKKLIVASAAPPGSAVADSCYWCGYPCGGYYCCDPYPYCGYYTNPFYCVCYRY